MERTQDVVVRRKVKPKRDWAKWALAVYVIILALMAPGFLLGLGTQLFWKYMGTETSLWHTALGTNSVWGIPFGFLVMLAIWNRYDDHIDEAARDLGAGATRTFWEV